VKIPFRKLRPDAIVPTYKHEGDSGLDLHACIEHDFIIVPRWEVRVIPCGIAFQIPDGFEGQIRPRSGYSKRGILVHFGTLDAPYRGEGGITVHNLSADALTIAKGDRVGQLVIAPVIRVELEEVEELTETTRGDRGWGSTGVGGSVG
jgi:dUTP pyrophosphatase